MHCLDWLTLGIRTLIGYFVSFQKTFGSGHSVVGFGILWFVTTGFSNPMIIFYSLIAAAFIFMAMRYTNQRSDTANVPKGLVLHNYDAEAAFIDATGAHAGALLGDVRHDPFQSGGLETPAHDRVEAGAIHKAHRGVLYIDEINLLKEHLKEIC